MSLAQRVVESAVKAMVGPIYVPDVASFGDPLAARIEWAPLVHGGSRHRSRDLVETAQGRVESKRAWPAFVMAGICAATGIGASFLLFPCGLLFGAVFLVGAVALMRHSPRVFDATRRECMIGKQTVEFAQIHALQVLEERVSGSEDSPNYTSYELNLVLKDGSRLNVLDHGDRARLERDAELLAKMLGCPIWNGVKARRLVPVVP